MQCVFDCAACAVEAVDALVLRRGAATVLLYDDGLAVLDR
jgi:hypothetical protein